MCRFNCYEKLNPTSFTFNEDYLIIEFSSAKNDQFYAGTTSVLAYQRGDLMCPYLIYKTYFRLMNFSMTTSESLNCRLTRRGYPRPNTRLSYSSSLSDTKELLSKFGYKGSFSEKSLKASAVTIALDKGAPITDIQIYGRWNSPLTPLAYHNSSIARRAAISRLL